MNATFIALGLLDVLVLSLLISAGGHWAPKLAVIVLVLPFNFLVWNATLSGRGWATTDTPPNHSIFISCLVEEPYAIYLWLIPTATSHSLLGYNPSLAEPRAFKLPYTQQLYQVCRKAKKDGSSGQVGLNRNSGRGPRHGTLHPYVLPPPLPETKEKPK
jgi:hypothetical protein